MHNNTKPKAIIGHATPVTVGSGLTHHVTFYGNGSAAGITTRTCIVPTACYVGSCSVRTAGISGGGGSIVYTLMVNQVATATVITIAAGSAAGFYQSSETIFLQLASGDQLSWRVANSSGATTPGFRINTYFF